MIDKIDKRSLAIKVYESLKSSLVLEYKEGDLIPSENALAKTFNVSRVVIREALLRLREERVVITYKGKGSFLANPKNFTLNKEITDLDFEKFQEIMEFRSLIECSAVPMAVKNADEQDIERLKSCVEQMERMADNIEAFNKADYEFHLAILKCAHNQTYITAIESVKDWIISCLNAMNNVNDSMAWGLELHPKIANCIINKDAKGAIDLLKNSGEYNLARMKELFLRRKL